MLYERRDIKRRHLIYHLEVTFDGSPAVAGHLADISPEGLLVITEQPLPQHHVLHLRLGMPPEWKAQPPLLFTAECRWSKRDVNPDYHANGLFIIDAPDNYLDILQRLTREYGFHN